MSGNDAILRVAEMTVQDRHDKNTCSERCPHCTNDALATMLVVATAKYLMASTGATQPPTHDEVAAQVKRWETVVGDNQSEG